MKKEAKKQVKKKPTIPGVTQEQFELILQAAQKRAAELEYLRNR